MGCTWVYLLIPGEVVLCLLAFAHDHQATLYVKRLNVPCERAKYRCILELTLVDDIILHAANELGGGVTASQVLQARTNRDITRSERTTSKHVGNRFPISRPSHKYVSSLPVFDKRIEPYTSLSRFTDTCKLHPVPSDDRSK